MQLITFPHSNTATSSSEKEHFCHKRCIISSSSSRDQDLSALHAVISPIFFDMSRQEKILQLLPFHAAAMTFVGEFAAGCCCCWFSGHEPRAQGIVLRLVSINCLLKTSESSDRALSTPGRSSAVRRWVIMSPESQGHRRMSGGWS